MDRDDIIRMAREAGYGDALSMLHSNALERFANLVAAAEREKVAQWMIQRSYATGHGDTTEDLLAELEWQIAENWSRAMINGVETEREACAKVCDEQEQRSRESSEKSKRERDRFMYHHCAVTAKWNAAAIRARGRE